MSLPTAIYQKKILVGKARRSPSHGPANCKAYVTVELRQSQSSDDGIELSICGDIWNHLGTDIFVGGQCLDTIPEYIQKWNIPQERYERICEVWNRWHLNGMNAGCEHQRALIPIIQQLRGDDFFWASNYEEIITLPFFRGCPLCDGYKYGSAWLHEELPAEIIEEVKSW